MEGEAPSLVLFHVFSKKGGRLGSYFPPRNIRKEQAHTGAQVQGEAFPLEGRNGQKSSASLVEQNITFFFFFLTTAIFLLCFPERENFLFLHSLTRNHERVTEMD